jgi:hypothetical protein
MAIRTVRFRVSGGFAGLVRGVDLPGGDLTAAERRALELRSTALGVARVDGARDLLTYELEVETDGGVQRVAFDEMNTPDDLAGLVRRLESRSRPMLP